MDKINIYLCLLSHEDENKLQNRHFPLSIGLISEYLKNNINNINTFLFKRPTLLSEKLTQLKPDIVMFSNYMWNEKLNCFYAKHIKEKYPETLILFGGPNISSNEENNIEFLKINKYIDILIKGDGELISKLLIEKFIQLKDIEKLKYYDIGDTLSILKDSNKVIYGKNELEFRVGVKNTSLNDVSSPYLSGSFNHFFEDASIPLLETNRGCPYGCTYCQQGDKYFSKIRYYNENRIKQELEYISKKIIEKKLDISIIEFADPNFGMYKNDTKIFKHIRYVQDNYNFPSEVWCSTGKSNQKLILDNAKILKDDSIMIRAAMQSLNQETLDAIKRKNLKLNIFDELSKDNKSIDIYSDIMLGLPLETKTSYIKGIYKLIDFGISEFSMPQTILLKGTPMENKEYIKEHNLITKYRVIPECDGVYNIFNHESRISENEKIIISTNTLSFNDYLECRKFNLIIMIFHNTRMLNCIYKYFDTINIQRSKVISSIITEISNSIEFNKLLDNYIKDTKLELSSEELTFDKEDNIESRISNKIYKHLTVVLFFHKPLVTSLIKKALLLLLIDDTYKINTLITIIDDIIIDNLNLNINNKEINYLFDNKVITFYSKFQVDRINSLKKIYTKEDDIINKLAYHLRPINMIKKIKYDN